MRIATCTISVVDSSIVSFSLPVGDNLTDSAIQEQATNSFTALYNAVLKSIKHETFEVVKENVTVKIKSLRVKDHENERAQAILHKIQQLEQELYTLTEQLKLITDKQTVQS